MINFFFLFLFLFKIVFGNIVETYDGEARWDDKLVYTEKHTVVYTDSKKPQKAMTQYFNPDGKLIAELNSDFSKSITSPEHTFQDFRSGHRHGIRLEGDKVVLFKQDKGELEVTKALNPAENANRTYFGCQGLHYFLREKMDEVNGKKELPIVFITPGNLDNYNFELEYVGEKPGGLIDYEIEIDNFFLRIFAPKLKVTYDKNLKRIVYYKGISNLLTDKGDNQKVIITYKYPPELKSN